MGIYYIPTTRYLVSGKHYDKENKIVLDVDNSTYVSDCA